VPAFRTLGPDFDRISGGFDRIDIACMVCMLDSRMPVESFRVRLSAPSSAITEPEVIVGGDRGRIVFQNGCGVPRLGCRMDYKQLPIPTAVRTKVLIIVSYSGFNVLARVGVCSSEDDQVWADVLLSNKTQLSPSDDRL